MILTAPRLATLNGHPGWLPIYRGLGSAYFQTEDGLPPAMSVHRVDEGIDSGLVYAREWLAPGLDRPDQLELLVLLQGRGRLLAKVIRTLERCESVG